MSTLEPPVAQTAFHRRETLHQEAERIAVPNFDWIAAPVDGMVEAVVAASHVHFRHHEPSNSPPPAPA